jgi:pimeloyl-ACP methyl ester carboxylesterase
MDRRAFGMGILTTAACASTPRFPPRAVDEGSWVAINGFEQWIAFRGRSDRNPVMLFLQGGPGIGAASSAPLLADWEADFTISLWDQPGSGATGVRNMADQGELTLDRYARDGIAVAEHVRSRFGVQKLVLMGISWGTQLGVEMVKRRPDLFSVYVGTAQVTGLRGLVKGYELALAEQKARGNAAGVAALERVGPPPYRTFEDILVRQQFTNPPGQPMSAAEAAKTAAMNKLLTPPNPNASYTAYPVLPPGFDGMKMFMNTLRAVFLPGSTFEIRNYGRDFPIPVFVFQGENDFNAPEVLAREWICEIRAPKRVYEVIPGAGHNTLVFHGELLALLRKHVLPVVI